MMPLTETGWLGASGALAAAPLIGFAFGWFLERGGLGSAPQARRAVLPHRSHRVQGDVQRAPDGDARRVLAGSARRAAISISSTCPRHSCCRRRSAACCSARVPGRPACARARRASPRRPGAATASAVIGGHAARRAALQRRRSTGSQPFYDSTALGAVTLTDLVGVSRGAGVALVTAVALGGFAVAGRSSGHSREPPRNRGGHGRRAGSGGQASCAAAPAAGPRARTGGDGPRGGRCRRRDPDAAALHLRARPGGAHHARRPDAAASSTCARGRVRAVPHPERPARDARRRSGASRYRRARRSSSTGRRARARRRHGRCAAGARRGRIRPAGRMCEWLARVHEPRLASGRHAGRARRVRARGGAEPVLRRLPLTTCRARGAGRLLDRHDGTDVCWRRRAAADGNDPEARMLMRAGRGRRRAADARVLAARRDRAARTSTTPAPRSIRASLVRRDARRLATRVLGNPHSESAPSLASTDALDEARRLTLQSARRRSRRVRRRLHRQRQRRPSASWPRRSRSDAGRGWC